MIESRSGRIQEPRQAKNQRDYFYPLFYIYFPYLWSEWTVYSFHITRIQYIYCFFSQHKAICEFPSRWFYDGKLQCAVNCNRYQTAPSMLPRRLWRGGQTCPILFCHVEGQEETQYVMTDEASDNSKSNQKEAEQAVSQCFFRFDLLSWHIYNNRLIFRHRSSKLVVCGHWV